MLLPPLKPPRQSVHWLSEDDYAKARGQLKMQMIALLADTYSMHGYKELASDVGEVAVRLAEDFGLRVRGLDKLISVERVRNGRGHGSY